VLKIKVRDLARRLTAVRGTEMTPGDVVALAEAAGVPVGVSGSLDESQVYVMLGLTDLPRRDLAPQLMAAEWPPPQPRPFRSDVAAPIRSAPPRPVPASRPVPPPRPPRSRGGDGLGPVGFPVSEASRRAAAAARPAPPPPRPLVWPVAQPQARRRRESVNGPRPSVRVADLGSLVRAILPEDLRGKRWIWPDEAARWNAQADRWARAGFTDRSVLRWLETGLRPADAGYLAARGVKPDALGQLVRVPVTVVAAGYAMVRMLLISGRLPVAAVYDALVAAGHHVPVPEPDLQLVLAQPGRPVTDRPAAPSVLFSNPGHVDDPERRRAGVAPGRPCTTATAIAAAARPGEPTDGACHRRQHQAERGVPPVGREHVRAAR
jgi:hypothetical protein